MSSVNFSLTKSMAQELDINSLNVPNSLFYTENSTANL